MAKLLSTNPAKNYEIVGEVEISTPEEIREKVAKANAAREDWKNIGVQKRKEFVQKIYNAIAEHKEQLEELCTKEMGMPKKWRNMFDADFGLDYFEWYLANVEKALAPEVSFEDDKGVNTTYYEPIGTAAVITPWNFPITFLIWTVIPNLLAGNTVIWKHSEECALVGKKLEELIATCQLPEGVFAEVYGDGKVGDILVHEDVQLICFTGSTTTGKYLYKIAGEKFIKTHLELGGSAPGIIFEDADIGEVVEGVFFARFANSGQICDGLKRLIVHKSRLEEVIQALKDDLTERKTGSPEEEDTDIGPLVSKKQLEALRVQVADAIEKRVKVEMGGKVPEGLQGAYFEPTLLTNVTTDMKVWNEEVFGPVLPIVTFSTEEEAIALANDSVYGLGGYVWTKDKERATRVGQKLQTGMVQTNLALYVHPGSPFGGYKNSGMGREHGKYGFQELCQIKVVATEK